MSGAFAWQNAVDCTIATAPSFLARLAPAVSNSGDQASAAYWLLSFIGQWLQSEGQKHDGFAAFDFAVFELEAIEKLWPAFEMSAEMQPISTVDALPKLAEFIARRLPTAWEKPAHEPRAAPVSRVIAAADHIDTMVSLFAAGEAPNGSKDPLALRREALRLLADFVIPLPPKKGEAA